MEEIGGITRVALGKVPEGKQTLSSNKTNAKVGKVVSSGLLTNSSLKSGNSRYARSNQQLSKT